MPEPRCQSLVVLQQQHACSRHCRICICHMAELVRNAHGHRARTCTDAGCHWNPCHSQNTVEAWLRKDKPTSLDSSSSQRNLSLNVCYMLSFRLRPSWRTRLGLLFAVSDHTWTSRGQARRHSGSDPRDGAWGVAGGQARRGSQAGGLVGRRGGGAGREGGGAGSCAPAR